MSKCALVISDLHLADGHPILDGFGQRQQAAFEGLLHATQPGGSLSDSGDVDDIELVINGDCFDFLTTPPYLADGISTPAITCEKITAIVTHHRPFFEALRRFLETPGRHVTFLPGNHDIELIFPAAQQMLCQAICGQQSTENVTFINARAYRPMPDVYIEHGNHYDFWNYAPGVWDDDGRARVPAPQKLMLPIGTQYFHRVSSPISIAYPYFDHVDPTLGSLRQIALLCLLDPRIVIETAHRAMSMLSYHRVALEALEPGEEQVPVTLFERAIVDFAAFQQDMRGRQAGWEDVDAMLREQPGAQQDPQAETIQQYFVLRGALALPPVEAARVILTSGADPANHNVTLGMQHILRDDPTLRYAIAGHTHTLYRGSISSEQGEQVYLNTATWTHREALPAAGEITSTLLEWLRAPSNMADPLREITRFVFALIESKDGQDGQPSSAKLCAWEGGTTGHYHILAEGKE
jgi:UDP-2,3-diacylglucosamine pyrophosphatase LpxH